MALSVDYDSGELLGFRIFPAVIGPVFPIQMTIANEIIAGLGVQEVADGTSSVCELVAVD